MHVFAVGGAGDWQDTGSGTLDKDRGHSRGHSGRGDTGHGDTGDSGLRTPSEYMGTHGRTGHQLSASDGDTRQDGTSPAVGASRGERFTNCPLLQQLPSSSPAVVLSVLSTFDQK